MGCNNTMDVFDMDLMNVRYPISLTRNSSTNKKKYNLKITGNLQPSHGEIIDLLENNEFEHPVQVIKKLKELLMKASDTRKSCINHTPTYYKVLSGYTELHNFHINIEHCLLSNDLSCIELAHLDVKQRVHHLTVQVNYARNGHNLFNISKYDLPTSIFSSLSSNAGSIPMLSDDSLVCLYDKYVACLNSVQMQEYFDLMDLIDNTCWVLDPPPVPLRKDNYRRIALSDKVSIVISFKPSNVKEIPNIKFLGPQHLIKDLINVQARNVLDWMPSDDVLGEVLKMLEIPYFPSAPKSTTEIGKQVLLVDDGECCICCSSRFNGNLPEIICPNSSCNQCFHADCLYQWLQLMNMNIFYSDIVGKCPNCEKIIRCPVPTSSSASV